MKKEKAFYQALFRKTTALKLAIVVIFVMLINMLNLPVIISGDYSSASNKYILKLENKLGKIYNAVNLPVKLMNDLFQEQMSITGGEQAEQSGARYSYALFVPLKKSSKKSADASLFAAAVQAGGSANKFISKSFTAFQDVYFSYGGVRAGYLESNDIVRYMLLFLILFLMLPRGIPVKNKKNININFAFPVFINDKVGIFRFLTGCKGSVK